MQRHGPTLPYHFASTHGEAADTDNAAPTCPVPQVELRGYRHFLRNPRPEERFRIGERDPRDAEDETRGLMKRLADCMWSRPASWSRPLVHGLEVWENPDIPSGYTYLAQLLMHDLVHSADALPTDPRSPAAVRNHRVSRLALDTIYDSGPSGCPHAYAQHEDRKPRMRLRLGPIGAAGHQVMRDIRRIGFPADTAGEASTEAATEALVADPRNDDNLILAQLTALFHMLHNAMLGKLHALDPIEPGITSFDATRRHFMFAREIVALVFRACVRNDLLTRILHPQIYKRYADNPVFMDQPADGMPVEFAHAAGRFGHAMVRPSYQLNQNGLPVPADTLLRLTTAWTPTAFPLDRSFLIQWSRFFAFPGAQRPNYSRRLEPSMEKLDSNDSRDIHSLAERDLLRGASLDLWSVWALRKEIERRAPGTTGLSAVLADPDEARKKIAAFLTDRVEQTGLLSPTDVAKLAADPPLAFFVLFEAAQGPGEGRYLGVLGSVIVAEVVFGALAAAGTRSVRDIARQIYGGAAPDVGALADRIARIQTAPDLVRFVAEASGPQPADLPLI